MYYEFEKRGLTLLADNAKKLAIRCYYCLKSLFRGDGYEKIITYFNRHTWIVAF